MLKNEEGEGTQRWDCLVQQCNTLHLLYSFLPAFPLLAPKAVQIFYSFYLPLISAPSFGCFTKQKAIRDLGGKKNMKGFGGKERTLSKLCLFWGKISAGSTQPTWSTGPFGQEASIAFFPTTLARRKKWRKGPYLTKAFVKDLCECWLAAKKQMMDS